MTEPQSLRVAFVCDVSPSTGVGHVMRSLAVVEELVGRGGEAILISGPQLPKWTEQAATARGAHLHAWPGLGAAAMLTALEIARPTAVWVDSYLMPHETREAIRDRWPAAVMVDGEAGVPVGDVVIDQNVGSEDAPPVGVESGAQLLLGARYALIRDEFAPRATGKYALASTAGGGPRVVVVMGGTDPHGATPMVLQMLADTGDPFRAAVVVADGYIRQKASDVALGNNQRVTFHAPGALLPGLVATADLVVSAAGSSTWELMAMGSCAALIQVAENQSLGYQASVRGGLCVGLGRLDELRQSWDLRRSAVEKLDGLLTDSALRAEYGRAAAEAVDGRGRTRVLNALLAAARRREGESD